MTDSSETPRITRNDDESRYEIHLGEVLAGFTRWEADDRGRLQMVHTEVDPAFTGRGLASILVADALGDIAERDETIVPRCPFVVRYLRDNSVPGLSVDWPHGAPTDD
ncbi:GNAT family N-acetyltransferase [Microbacterium xanthum]|uniref:GNAT family N-acetyltransferase n=1 Tax=Microbacterium xanthum TaxID=3079794 RepID=UPI002AD3FF36|nr:MULTISPECIES: GNAT family N-acetyltransferase [unclassified Microbacterium]MDZ8171456.1 GNAT family N-acetyltransferase [Microbacterium sp. KSW-48]MDZ8200506.1 GNAT family N-acetyltransferase [Microbacterium sp. SSW1-59]